MMEDLGEDWTSPSSSTSLTAGVRALGSAAIFPPPPPVPQRPNVAGAPFDENDQAGTGQRRMPYNTADPAARPGLLLPVRALIVGAGTTDIAGLMRQMMVFQHERQLQEQSNRQRQMISYEMIRLGRRSKNASVKRIKQERNKKI